MAKSFSDNLYLHAFNLMPQFGPAKLMKAGKYFKSFAQAFEAGSADLQNAGLEPELAEKFLRHRASVSLELEEQLLLKHGIKILSFWDANYPSLLKEIPKAPPILYFRGQLGQPDELCLAVVGTRNVTAYGRTVLPGLIEPIIDVGVTIVSGMAFGVDSAAQELAVKRGRRTIAVLGGGLDDPSLYPRHHQLLAQRVLDAGGALISEYPVGTPNFKQNFVARNRIISGLSVATLVIECDLQSGTLITAKHALDQNRSLYAVPGPIYSLQSQGPNNLIKMGAKPLTNANDVLEDLNLKALPEQKSAQNLIGDSKEESTILKMLGYEPVIINELIKQSGLEAATVTSALTFLEMKGKVRNLGGQQYVLSR
jgi:DNA processing protein